MRFPPEQQQLIVARPPDPAGIFCRTDQVTVEAKSRIFGLLSMSRCFVISLKTERTAPSICVPRSALPLRINETSSRFNAISLPCMVLPSCCAVSPFISRSAPSIFSSSCIGRSPSFNCIAAIDMAFRIISAPCFLSAGNAGKMSFRISRLAASRSETPSGSARISHSPSGSVFPIQARARCVLSAPARANALRRTGDAAPAVSRSQPSSNEP